MLHLLAHIFTPGFSNNHRPKLLHPTGTAVLIAIVLVFNSSIEIIKALSPQGLVLGYASNITAGQVFEQVNRQRLQANLPPLKLNKYLNQAAQEKAKHMFALDYWDHIAPDGTTPWKFIKDQHYYYTVAGENLARDFDSTAPMVAAWMDSPTHRANIVHEKYQDTGIAVVDGKLNGVETTLVVQLFGAPAAPAQPGSPSAPTSPQISQAAPSTQESFTQPSTFPQVASVFDQSENIIITLSPLQIKQSLALAILLLLAFTIAVDEYVAHKKGAVRFVGRNLAHLSFLAMVIILIMSVSQPGSIQ